MHDWIDWVLSAALIVWGTCGYYATYKKPERKRAKRMAIAAMVVGWCLVWYGLIIQPRLH